MAGTIFTDKALSDVLIEENARESLVIAALLQKNLNEDRPILSAAK